jgi:hypothetical protein
MKAFRTIKQVAKRRKILLTDLPFEQGRSVEIIVFPARTEAEEIHARIRSDYRKRRVKPPTPTQVRKTVHDLRKIQ